MLKKLRMNGSSLLLLDRFQDDGKTSIQHVMEQAEEQVSWAIGSGSKEKAGARFGPAEKRSHRQKA